MTTTLSVPDPVAEAPADLAGLRAEFDAVDDALHDLLMRRAGLSRRLAGQGLKAAPFRPGREAEILRRLLARNAAPLSRETLVRLWREIVAASLRQQGPLTVAALPGMEGLARGHFGLDAPLRAPASPARALAALSSGEASVAVLPAPGDGEAPEAAWWTSLDSPRLQVVAALPFLLPPGQGGPSALVLAPFAPDPTARDRGLLRLERAPNTSRDALAAALAAARLPPLRLFLSADGAHALAEVEGLLDPDDPRLPALATARPTVLGGHAEPEPATPDPDRPDAR